MHSGSLLFFSDLTNKLNFAQKGTNMNIYTSIDQLPLTLTAEQVARYLNISRAGAYQLFHSTGFPTIRIGKRMLVERDKFLLWVNAQSQEQKSEGTTE